MIARRAVIAVPLAAIIAIAALLRIPALGDGSLWLDEAWSRWMAEQDWQGLRDSTARFDTHPPFYYSLLKLWLWVSPSTSFGLRLLSALAGLLLVPVAWLCARQVTALQPGAWPALLAALLVALSLPLIVAASQARPYALFALAFALSLLAALRLSRSADGSPARPGAACWLAYLVSLELVLWLHSLGVLFAASLAAGLFLALMIHGLSRRVLFQFAAVHLLALVAWLPCLIGTIEQRRHWTATWLRFDWNKVPDGLAQGLVAPGLASALVVLAAAIGALMLLWRRPGRPAAILLVAASLGPAAMTITLSAIGSPVFLPRTLVPSVVPLLLLAVAGAAGFRNAWLQLGVAAPSLIVLALALPDARPPQERWRGAAAWLDRNVRSGDEVWLLPNELVLPLRYAADEWPPDYRVRGIPADFPAPDHIGPRLSGTVAVPAMTRADAERLLVEARQRGTRNVFVVSRLANLFDPQSHLPRALGRHRLVSRDLHLRPLIIDKYRLEDAIAAP